MMFSSLSHHVLLLHLIELRGEIRADHTDRHRQHDDPTDGCTPSDNLPHPGGRVVVAVAHRRDRDDHPPPRVRDGTIRALRPVRKGIRGTRIPDEGITPLNA